MASNYVYGTILRHASSAGGTLATDEDWVIKSWYGEMHRMTIDEILTVGVGMSPSQKTMCVRLSIAAYNRGVFPDHYFMEHEGTKVIVPDVGNFDLWFLLHEIVSSTNQLPQQTLTVQADSQDLRLRISLGQGLRLAFLRHAERRQHGMGSDAHLL